MLSGEQARKHGVRLSELAEGSRFDRICQGKSALQCPDFLSSKQEKTFRCDAAAKIILVIRIRMSCITLVITFSLDLKKKTNMK